MIGGVDLIIPSLANREEAILVSLRLLRHLWRDAVVENAKTGEKTLLARDALLPETAKDIFIYLNQDTADQWDKLGAQPELANTMIHVMVRESEVTVVVDDPHSGIVPEFISSLRNALRMPNFRMRAKGAAA
jgi:hypothetical protein